MTSPMNNYIEYKNNIAVNLTQTYKMMYNAHKSGYYYLINYKGDITDDSF